MKAILKSNLPLRINFSTCELMLVAAACIVAGSSRTLDENIHMPSSVEYMKDKTFPTLRISKTGCSWYDTNNHESFSDAPLVTNLQELYDVLYEAPMKVGDYDLEVQDAGIQVGCTFVSWAQVKQIAALAPEVKTDDSF